MDELDKIYVQTTGGELALRPSPSFLRPPQRIPVGMPEGISGEELLKILRDQTPEELEECRKRGAL